MARPHLNVASVDVVVETHSEIVLRLHDAGDRISLIRRVSEERIDFATSAGFYLPVVAVGLPLSGRSVRAK